jgi:hypothetical protein
MNGLLFSSITISVVRPEHGVSIFTCDMENIQTSDALRLFPDNKEQRETSFPGEGITIISKPQGHIVIAYQHLEKWILAGFSHERVDLSFFSDHWKGCSVTLLKTTDI